MTLDFLIPPALMLAPILLLGLAARGVKRHIRRPGRRSPLTQGLLRGPGHSLRSQLEELRWDAGAVIFAVTAVLLMLYILFLQKRLSGTPVSEFMVVAYAGTALATVAFGLARTVRAVRRLHSLQLGLEAEVASAEELNRLMHQGYWVFHDLPADGPFNVDHVVVGPTGVFAVETKGRPKRSGKDAKDGHVVRYDGVVLRFPGWAETEPLEQAARNAKWLQRWLTEATGEPVSARPVVVLPGWYVDRAIHKGVAVISAREAASYFPKVRSDRLSDEQVRRIAHQLDRRCRDVDPLAYGEGK